MKKDNPFDPEDAFRPRIGRKAPPTRDRVPTFRGQILHGIQRHGGWRSAGGKAGRRRGLVAVREPFARSRRCVVKGRYVAMTAYGYKAAKLHLAYLERDGVERDGSRGRLYGADEGLAAETFRSRLKNEQRQFRFIVSPEDGDALDLKEFARQFMKQVERDAGRQLIWAAVNHHNTANPHVHIVIRGVDRDGDDLRIDGRYIAQEMRWRAQEILTNELGLRSDLELEQGRSADITREGFTPIDRMLARHLSDEGRLAPGQFADMPRLERAARLARLAKLEEMGLARREAGGVWSMANDWETTLKLLAIDGEVRQRIGRHVPGSTGRGQVLQAGEQFETVEGIVRGVGLHDELVGSMYMVVERAGGPPCYLPVRPEVAEGLAVGDKVRVSCAAESWVKATDRIVARVAAEHGGIYDPAAHQQALSMRGGRDAGGGQPSSADLVAANVRRLERLERYGLVARDGAGRWRVPTDLVAKLAAREVSHPRHRIQIERLGPVRQIERTPLERPPGRGPGRGMSR